MLWQDTLRFEAIVGDSTRSLMYSGDLRPSNVRMAAVREQRSNSRALLPLSLLCSRSR
jgi:hypothetical protein